MPLFGEILDEDGFEGLIDARIYFDRSAFLDVFERLKIDQDGTPHRVKYSYHLEVDGLHVRRWDAEPLRPDPQLQFHINNPLSGGGVTHELDKRRPLKDVVEECWELVTRARENEPD